MRARTAGLAAAAALAAGLPTLLAGLLGSTAAHLTLGPDDSMVRTHTAGPGRGPDDAALGLVGAHPPTGPRSRSSTAPAAGEGDGSRGVPIRVSGTALPARVLLAYRNAADDLRALRPGLPPLVEPARRHRPGRVRARLQRRVDRKGRTLNPILGPVLNGVGDVAAIPDTDGGRWDGDTTWDRAVGPMQFIPSSWRSGAATATATARPTRPTSTTPPWRPRRTSAPATATCRTRRTGAARSSATTTPGTTSTWCSPGPTRTRPASADHRPAARPPTTAASGPSAGSAPGEGPSTVLALPAPGATQQPATAGDATGSDGSAGSAAPPSAAPAEGPRPAEPASSPTATTTAAPSDPPTGPDPCATPSPTDTPTG